MFVVSIGGALILPSQRSVDGECVLLDGTEGKASNREWSGPAESRKLAMGATVLIRKPPERRSVRDPIGDAKWRR